MQNKVRTRTLEYVPEELKSPELYLAAIQNNVYALMHVPERLKTAKFLANVISINPDAYTPEELQLAELLKKSDS